MGTASERTAGRTSAYGPLLRNKSFMALWLGQTVSFVGDYFYWLAIPIMINRLTGSTLMVGLSLISNSIPALILGPVAGVFVDRWNRKWTMIAADVLRALLVLLCLLVRTPDQVWIYYVAGFLMACVSRFFFPAQSATLPLIVKDRNDLLAANGLMQVIQTAGLLAGPAMAGFSIKLWGAAAAFIIDSASFLVSAAAILIMNVPHTTAGHQATGGQVRAVWAEMREGVAFLFGDRTMVGVLISLSVVHLGLGAMNVLWVPYLQGAFGVDSDGLGIVDSAQGLGMLVSGVALGWIASRFTKTALIGWGLVLLGVLLGAVGLVPAFIYIVVLSFVVGLPLVPVQSALATLMQLAVPDLKRGRVGSSLNAIGTLALLLSMGAASMLGDAVGLRTMYVIAGAIMMLSGVIALRIIYEPEAAAESSEPRPVPELAEGAAE